MYYLREKADLGQIEHNDIAGAHRSVVLNSFMYLSASIVYPR